MLGQWRILSHMTKAILGGAFVAINNVPTIIGGALQSGTQIQNHHETGINSILYIE